jgi:PqqD family protein of HPr-rel-A system
MPFGTLLTSSTSLSSIRWKSNAPDSCVWFDTGDGVVVYHRPSGKTHLLNEPSVRLLTDLSSVSRDLQAIAADFEPAENGPSKDVYLENLAQMLRRLEQFGLIERV